MTAAADAPFGWGLVGPGRIAHRFADALRGVPGAHLVAVQGRDEGRARDFAERWGAPWSGTGLDALLARDDVHAVYIATPHAFHAEAIVRCIAAGKPVLCEKPLVTDAITAARLVALAAERRVFLMEALWTRFLPVYAHVERWLREGAIGTVQSVQSSFCFPGRYDPASRTFDPAQAGGALLDLGVYNLSMSQWVLARTAADGRCPAVTGIHASAVIAPTGVDQRLAGMLHFDGGAVAQFVCGFDGLADNALAVHGSAGTVEVRGGFWSGSQAVLTRAGADPEPVHAPHAVNGFEYEVAEAQRCVRAGLLESPGVPHADTLAVTDWMDRLRALVGVRYPFDPPR
jgi:predicted dehydrogenase